MAMGISMRMIPENVHNYKKLDLKSDDKFVLQDSDLRNMLSKKTKVRKIKKTDISTDKFLNKVSNNKIVVKNIGEDVTENDIEKLFSETGIIFDVKITEDSYTNNKAIIVFKSSEQAKNSINKFNGEMLDGRKMNIELFTEDFNKYPVFVRSSEKSSKKKVSFVKPSYTEKFVQEDNPYDFSRFEEKEKEEGPVYTPGSPSYTPSSPGYTPQSPTYTPQSPTYTPQSPTYEPVSPTYTPVSPTYTPVSPGYTPQSPTYTPVSPGYTPQSPGYTPVSPKEQDNFGYMPQSPKETYESPEYKANEESVSPTYAPDSPTYQTKTPFEQQKDMTGGNDDIKIIKIDEKQMGGYNPLESVKENESQENILSDIKNEISNEEFGIDSDIEFDDSRLETIDLNNL